MWNTTGVREIVWFLMGWELLEEVWCLLSQILGTKAICHWTKREAMRWVATSIGCISLTHSNFQSALSLQNSNRSPRGSIAPESLCVRTSPRGSIASEHPSDRSPRGSIGPDMVVSANRSPRGSIGRSTLAAEERSPRGSLTLTFQEPPVSERRASADNPLGMKLADN